MDQRDVVQMMQLVVVEMANHAVDDERHARVIGKVARPQPHAIALFDLGLVDAVRRGHDPAIGDQRPATAMGKLPIGFGRTLGLGVGGGIGVRINLRLPWRAKAHRGFRRRSLILRPSRRRDEQQ